jgi:NAD(P)-dependent dehydrogenase (short-subunit alcohol dehydrogenase family)
MSRFDDKVAVITGGSSGMALATAKLLAHRGAHVYITGRRPDVLDKAVVEVGPRATGIQGDAANLSDLDHLYDTVRAEHGRLDVLFASAGGGGLGEPLGSVTADSFDGVFDLNVRGTVFAVQKAVPLMTEGGSIVINGTVAAVKGIPGSGVYSASKAALRSFVRVWAAELAPQRIRVNLIQTGTINTPLIAAAPKEFVDGLVSLIPLGRTGEPEEIATAVAFLASEEASFITGGELFVDGGMAQV